jgi:hypothetical protein
MPLVPTHLSPVKSFSEECDYFARYSWRSNTTLLGDIAKEVTAARNLLAVVQRQVRPGAAATAGLDGLSGMLRHLQALLQEAKRRSRTG